MLFVGLDLHKKYSEFAVMDMAGNVMRQGRIENTLDKMREFSESLPSPSSMVVESSSTWYWAHRLLSERHDVVLSNPIKNKAIASAKVKTDKIDATMLVTLLRGGFVAECYVPSKETMEFRELVRYRANLVRMRTNVENRIHGHLLMNNVRIDAKPFSKGFVEEIRRVDDLKVQGYLRLVESVDREVHEASRAKSKEAADDAGARLLMTIPGVSFYSALLVTSEIGDVSRFQDSDSLVAYAGLVPSTHSSGGTTYHGRITKTGSPYLRWILGQCTRINIRNEPGGRLALFYDRLARKKGSQKAIVAATAKLLRIIYWMLREGEPYHG